MPTKFPTSQTRKVRPASGRRRGPPIDRRSLPPSLPGRRPGPRWRRPRAVTRNADRRGRAESDRASANVTLTFDERVPRSSSSDDPRGSKTTPTIRTASTVILRTAGGQHSPSGSHGYHTPRLRVEYAKKSEKRRARGTPGDTTMVRTLPKNASFRRRDKTQLLAAYPLRGRLARHVVPAELYVRRFRSGCAPASTNRGASGGRSSRGKWPPRGRVL